MLKAGAPHSCSSLTTPAHPTPLAPTCTPQYSKQAVVPTLLLMNVMWGIDVPYSGSRVTIGAFGPTHYTRRTTLPRLARLMMIYGKYQVPDWCSHQYCCIDGDIIEYDTRIGVMVFGT